MVWAADPEPPIPASNNSTGAPTTSMGRAHAMSKRTLELGILYADICESVQQCETLGDERWQGEYPDIPVGLLLDHHAAAGYAAGQVLEAAVTEARSLAPEAVRNALFSLVATTVFGRYRWDEQGVRVGRRVPFIGYWNGLREVIWPLELAT